MAYEINHYNGTALVSVDDQTINTSATDLKLVGRNYSGYGEIQNENYVWLLENFANTAPPSHPIPGQIWFDATNKKLKVYDGALFKSSGSAEVSATQPTNLSAGDFWFNTTDQQLFAWSGTEFVLIGPPKTEAYGTTSAQPLSIKDSLGSNHEILKIQVASETIAIVSSENFTINSIINPIAGFNELRKGINFINSDGNGVTSSEHRFWGTAANSQRLGGLSASDFLRSANPVFNTQVAFKDSGIVIGDQGDLKLFVKNGTETIVENTLGNPITVRITNNPSDVRDVANFTEDGVIPGLDEFYNLGSVGAKWKEIRGKDIYATTFHGNLIGNVSGPDINTPINLTTTVINGGLTITQHLITQGYVQLNPTTPGVINNTDIGTSVRRSAKFTTIDVNDTAIFTKNAQSTTTTTGTIIVTGGIGLSGNLNAGGNGAFSGTGALKVPVGTTAQRPAPAVQGMIRYNTSIADFEGYDGAEWKPLGGGADDDYGLVTGIEDVIIDYGSVTSLV